MPSDEAQSQASTTHLFDGHIWNVSNVCVLGAPRNQYITRFWTGDFREWSQNHETGKKKEHKEKEEKLKIKTSYLK